MPEKQFPNRLRELRAARGLSAEAVGRLAGMSGPTVTRLETGNRRLKMDQAERLAKALGVGVAEVAPSFTGEAAPVPPAPPPERPGRGCANPSRQLMARRFRAARIASHPDLEGVAGVLRVSAETLREYESGDRPLDDAFLMRFAEVTKCPLDWIFLGKITSAMAPEMAIRIGLADPELAASAVSGVGELAVAPRKPAPAHNET